jgi:hypothetical protein
VAKDGHVRVELAFEGGQTVGGLVSTDAVDRLKKAMAAQEPVFDLETEDGTYSLAIGKIVYVKRSSRETRIGFGTAA